MPQSQRVVLGLGAVALLGGVLWFVGRQGGGVPPPTQPPPGGGGAVFRAVGLPRIS